MPNPTLLHIPQREQTQMLDQLRQARCGYLLPLHILLLYADGRTPTEISQFLFCSRTTVYRTVDAYQCGKWTGGWSQEDPSGPEPGRLLSWHRSLLTLVNKAPSVFGWCRTRWSCASLALELRTQRGYQFSRETVRLALHQLHYAWKRARPKARDDDPQRVGLLARIRYLAQSLTTRTAFFFADELDIHLLPKIGYEWMPKGTQKEVWTPGTNEKNYLAGALNYQTGQMVHVTGPNKNRFLFLDLLKAVDRACPAQRFDRIYLVVDNYRIHKAKVVNAWLSEHPRFELVWLPSYCPKANPIERAFGDVHDKCTRNHRRKRLPDLIEDVRRHLRVNGPWRYRLSKIYDTPEIDAAVGQFETAAQLQAA